MLTGTFILQLDEVFDISRPVRDRYKPNNGKNRLLKLVLFDGKCIKTSRFLDSSVLHHVCSACLPAMFVNR